MSEHSVEKSYDEVPYPSGAFEQTHPDRLATVATLFGMRPAPLSSCRVLELGCASGGNLVPMAHALPGATFLGVDISSREIADGLPWIERLGLRNLRLEQRDIMDLDASTGTFDYIIAHGVLSWVPRPVQDKIFEILGQLLSPNGVGYVSYNALPGGHIRRMLRDMMRFHVRDLHEPERRTAQGRALAGFLAGSIPESNPLYRKLLQGEVERVGKLSDEVLIHDDLSELNEAFYFHQVVERASPHGLKYLGEALFADMQDQLYSPEVQKTLRASGDLVTCEQYLDFLACRAFRQTLFCRSDVPLIRDLDAGHARPFHILSLAKPLSETPDVLSTNVERFKNLAGTTVGMGFPLAKAAMVVLAETAPRALSFEALLAAARARLRPPGSPAPGAETMAQEERDLGEMVIMAYGGNMLELHLHEARCVLSPSERPEASVVARLQAQGSQCVTSLWHKNISIDDAFAHRLLQRLDGTLDRPGLIEALAADAEAERFPLLREGAKVDAPAEIRALVGEKLEPALVKMARYALLSG
ncbi:MAG: class I SAM-dependent methyltransferase [Minicystis sp.]